MIRLDIHQARQSWVCNPKWAHQAQKTLETLVEWQRNGINQQIPNSNWWINTINSKLMFAVYQEPGEWDYIHFCLVYDLMLIH